MKDLEGKKIIEEARRLGFDPELYRDCLENSDGNREQAKTIYLHRRNVEINLIKAEDADAREKWPMLAPLLILYTVGTIGVLLLVFGFLGFRLNWW